MNANSTATTRDSWAGDIITAAIAHLAHSTPSEFQFTSTEFNSYVTVSIAEGAPQRLVGSIPTCGSRNVASIQSIHIEGPARGLYS